MNPATLTVWLSQPLLEKLFDGYQLDFYIYVSDKSFIS